MIGVRTPTSNYLSERDKFLGTILLVKKCYISLKNSIKKLMCNHRAIDKTCLIFEYLNAKSCDFYR